MKNKTIEYLAKWHNSEYEDLDILTKELLDNNDPDLRRSQQEYSEWHEAAIMSDKAIIFYNNSTADEKIESQQLIGEGDLSKNPYTLMQKLNKHTLAARYETIVTSDLKLLRQLLDEDTWDGDTEIQQHIAILESSSADFKDDSSHVATQLTEEAEMLNEEAQEAFEVVNQLLKQ